VFVGELYPRLAEEMVNKANPVLNQQRCNEWEDIRTNLFYTSKTRQVDGLVGTLGLCSSQFALSTIPGTNVYLVAVAEQPCIVRRTGEAFCMVVCGGYVPSPFPALSRPFRPSPTANAAKTATRTLLFPPANALALRPLGLTLVPQSLSSPERKPLTRLAHRLWCNASCK